MASNVVAFVGVGNSPSIEGNKPAPEEVSVDLPFVRFSLPVLEHITTSPSVEGDKSQNEAQRDQNGLSAAAEHPKLADTSRTSRKPTVLLGSDGRPLSILKGRRSFGYAQARRLAEQLRVKFAFDRNETRFYCPDSNEHVAPPPAPAELRGAVRGFLKSSKKTINEAQELTQTAQNLVEEVKHLEHELVVMTQVYAERVQLKRELAKANQAVIVASAKPRRGLCCVKIH